MTADGMAPVTLRHALLLEPEAEGGARLQRVVQEAFPGIDARSARHADEFRNLLGEIVPDVAVVASAFAEVTADVLRRAPNACVIACAGHIADERIFKALLDGANGYVVKHDSTAGLVEEIRAIAGGMRPMSPGMARQVLKHFADRSALLDAGELRVLEGIASGATVHALTSRLGVVVAERIRSVYRKLPRSRS